jgi:hypothetical protein
MKKLTMALMTVVLLTVSANASSDCCNGSKCCNGMACCNLHKK